MTKSMWAAFLAFIMLGLMAIAFTVFVIATHHPLPVEPAVNYSFVPGTVVYV